MRKLFAFTLVLALLLAGCGGAPAPSGSIPESSSPGAGPTAQPTAEPVQPVKIRVAHHAGLSGCIIPGIDSIEGNDFFAQEGLDVEWVKFTSGPPEVAAMVSGDIQFGYLGHGAHTLAAEGKIEVISLNHLGNSEKIYVRKDSGIVSVEDLKGKVVATQLGTSGEVILKLALAKEGMGKDDLKIMNMDMAGAVAAFIAGQVDAIACWDVHATNVVEQVGLENLTLLASTGDFLEETAFPASWVVTPEYAAENEDVVVRFIRALYRCYDYRAEHYDESIRAAAEFIGAEYETFSKTRDDATNFTAAQLNEMMSDGSLLNIYQLQLDYFLKEGQVKEGDAADYVRIDLMEKAYDSYNAEQ